MARLELNPDESAALYELLDQVNVRGPKAKAMVLGIMLKLAEAQKPEAEGDRTDSGLLPLGRPNQLDKVRTDG